MSIKTGTCLNELPPNVRGKTRGKLKLTVLDIEPSATTRNSSSASNYSKNNQPSSLARNPLNSIGSAAGVSVKFIWWGQSHGGSADVVSFGPAQKANTKLPSVEYSINTSATLFQNYLSGCEPVEICISSCKTNLQIGTAFMRVPKSVVENCVRGPVEEQQMVEIFNPRNIVLGTIRMKYHMTFDVASDSARTADDIPQLGALIKDKATAEVLLASLDSNRSSKSLKSDINNFIAQSHHHNSRPATASSSLSLSSRAMDYLTGRDMSKGDENRALEEIQGTSPLESLAEDLTSRLRLSNWAIYDRIDSLRLAVKSIFILSAGLRELECQHLERMSFTVETHISPNLLRNARSRPLNDVIRFYSENVDEKEKRVDFYRDAIRSIQITEYGDNAYILFTVWSRPFGSKYSRCFGVAKFKFESMLEVGDLEQIRKLPIKSSTDKICVGYATVRVTLGTKGVHFGEDFMTTITNNKLHDSPPSTKRSKSCLRQKDPDSDLDSVPTFCRNCHNNETYKMPKSPNSSRDSSATSRSKSSNETSSSSRSQKSRSNQKNSGNSPDSNEEKEERQTIDTDKSNNLNSPRLLQGLLYVGSIRNVRELENGNYSLLCRPFWKDGAQSSAYCQNYEFNFLETFSVINNDDFLERTRNGHLGLELWQKCDDSQEQIVGTVRLPLHQFYIAFRDNVITSHVCQAKLPVISVDGWVHIMTKPTEPSGQMQALLAIGTDEQLEHLKASRGIGLDRRVYDNSSADVSQNSVPVAQIAAPPQEVEERSVTSRDAESQTCFGTINPDDAESTARRERLTDLLGNFIDTLAQNLPTNAPPDAPLPVETPISSASSSKKKTNLPPLATQVRRTSELLDVLQKALVTPPTSADGTSNTTLPPGLLRPPTSIHQLFKPECVKIVLEIENALHLPRTPAKIGNKKMLKRNTSTGKCKQTRLPVDEEPSAYVTFQAEDGIGQSIKSHEGFVYSTHVIEKSCNPMWNRRFELLVAADLLKNDEKRFILKVWRKRVTDLAQCRMMPTPLEDAIIGFVAVDLNVLLAGMPTIAGWFNIVDFNGRVNGQIKINVRPLEDLAPLKNSPPLPTRPPIVEPMNVPDEMVHTAPANLGSDLNNTVLSRAIKRKFTELEEITQRLRARLLDITGSPDATISVSTDEMAEADPVDEHLDEFEHDLNTTCEEDNFELLDNFAWLDLPGEASDQHACGGSSSSSTNESQERIRLISECLRKTALDNDGASGTCLLQQKERNPAESETATRDSDRKQND